MDEIKEYTVTEVSRILTYAVNSAFQDEVIVTGEVLGCKTYPSGHMYFTLSDGNSSISSAFFKGNLSRSKFIPKEGDKVKVYGEVKLYDKSNTCQLIVRSVEYNSEGMFWKLFEETKKKLLSEGLLDESRKREIPKYPKRVAVLTSKAGAVIKDFLITTKREGGLYEIELWNIAVQGLNYANQIAETIKRAGSHKERYDVIVVMRGGGSIEDLSVFNNENIARAVAFSSVPVISAVGHETDWTIIDYVSDMRSATPTAAALYLSSGYKHAKEFIMDKKNRLLKSADLILMKYNQHMDYINLKLEHKSPLIYCRNLKDKIDSLEKSLYFNVKNKTSLLSSKIEKLDKVIYNHNPKKTIENAFYKVNVYEKTIKTEVFKFIDDMKKIFSVYEKTMNIKLMDKRNKSSENFSKVSQRFQKQNPLSLVEKHKYRVDILQKSILPLMRNRYLDLSDMLKKLEYRFKKYAGEYYFEKSASLNILENKLELLNPYNVLERGYAVVSQKGSILSSVNDVSLEEKIEVKLKDGIVTAQPSSIERDKGSEKVLNENEEKIYK